MNEKGLVVDGRSKTTTAPAENAWRELSQPQMGCELTPLMLLFSRFHRLLMQRGKLFMTSTVRSEPAHEQSAPLKFTPSVR